MTRRRMPQRDHRGKFLPSAQRDERPKRPAGHDAPLGVTSPEPAGRRCEECSTELDEVRVRIRGHVLYVQHCPRCTPDPMEVLS